MTAEKNKAAVRPVIEEVFNESSPAVADDLVATGTRVVLIRRVVVLLTVAAMMAAMVVFAGPASAQEGRGCKAFGQNIATLAQNLGGTFGQFTSANAPLNDTVEAEQKALCG